MPTFRHLEVATTDGVSVVRVVDHELLDTSADEVAEELNDVAAQEGCKNLVLDLSGVGLLTSEMLGKVVVLNKRMRQKGGRLTLRGMRPYVREVFALTKLDTVIPIEPAERAAG